ncbi:hypothetical protein KL905_003468 [Ogataea polymorpha]|uniref:enoyl-[acyl-carrier-protein] reductase n=2 Tax=Ogataea polymorpha TaxID=460523 RepID=A0A9P8SZ30_9ASCO|nr:hypothetical protein KL937_003551 [Ogataea polymorpha]KAG7899457.1 hypothetical protein KL935_003767 [Ogataea polymorpha]KAG7919603.1 hypothetical protein KL905_003468 [Ogataea polymorpha]KAG7925798.1 hypothetical protein KL925_004208 [Ogataea polymorpha]KAG7932950.1 hypothetical protein KL934_003605 [Ogataea polymorpha]
MLRVPFAFHPMSRSFSSSAIANSIRAKVMLYSQYGQPDQVLRCVSHELPSSPKGKEVLLQTIACPINPSDINQIQGVYPSRPELKVQYGQSEPVAVGGNEGLFKVLAVGDQVSGLKEGDWVIPSNVNFGTWRSHVLSEESALMKMEKTISANQAATIAVNPSSAYQMLTLFEELKPGDWFIQNGGNSQVGRSAIQIGKKLGLNSISIVRNRDNLKELVDELTGLGATKVITEEENASKEFGKTIAEWTNGKPIKLALNCVGGDNCTNMVRKLGQDGTLVTYGGMSMKPVTIPTTMFIFKNITAKGFWVSANIKRIPGSRENTIKAVQKMMEDGDLVDVKMYENPVSADASEDQVYQAFQKALANSNKGKQLVVFS